MTKVNLYGRSYQVTKVFRDVSKANSYMMEHPEEGVIKVRRDGNIERIILANILDKGEINYKNKIHSVNAQ